MSGDARLLWCTPKQVREIETRARVKFIGAEEGAFGSSLLDQVRSDDRRTREEVEHRILATRGIRLE